jgi:hypothetical protein
VWTPKRIALLVVGFALFVTIYAIYAHFLGGIDGLPPLPEEYWPSDGPPIDLKGGITTTREADRKLSQAFGIDCDEVKRLIRLALNSRGLVVAADTFDFVDGRMKLTPFSIAIYGKMRPDSKYPEINTIRCDEAILTFDRPVNNPAEMGNRKIIAGELRSYHGQITIVNNRATPQQDDDIVVTIGEKPLFYREKDQKVWTDGVVSLLDGQTAPNPTMITANGMDLFLSTSGPQGTHRKPAKKPKNESISGVDRIILHKNVDMFLYVDSRSGFLGNGKTNPAAGGPTPGRRGKTRPPGSRAPGKKENKPSAADKSNVVIKTNGPFSYDVATDLAKFDIIPGVGWPQVVVTREHELGKGKAPLHDQLVCEHLEIQFRRKPNPDPHAPKDSRSVEREIESAHATGKKQVGLALETEQLVVDEADDLVYKCPTATVGSQTTLKGDPLIAAKDGNRLQAKVIWLLGASKAGGSQHAKAWGPGRIDMADRNSPMADGNNSKPRYPIHIIWNDLLESTKDGPYDLMTLTGDATFIDDDHAQKLKGQRLLVWLEPAGRGGQPPDARDADKQATPAPGIVARQRPHRLEVYEHVTASSPEMNIRDTEHLTVWFQDDPAGPGQLPARLPAGKAAGQPAPPGTKGKPAGKASGPAAPTGKGVPAGTAPPAGKTDKKPINLWAQSVVAHVIRRGPKNDLERLVTRGLVHVHQEGATSKEKGVDIKGETLELFHHEKGDLLVVHGDGKKFADLQLGELFLTGNKVTIDQKENTAVVDEAGAMDMPSNATFEGGKPARPGTRLKVFWNNGMFFDGKEATFGGGVQAFQDNGRLKCQVLQAVLDRTVSFREGQKGSQAAKVETLVCDKKVHVEDTVRENGKVVKYSRLVCPVVSVDNVAGKTSAGGPGIATVVQKGAVDSGMAGPASAPAAKPAHGARAQPAKPQEEMKLTRVEYTGTMVSTNLPNGRKAMFLDNVEVINVPSANPDLVVDKDRLPQRGMYLRCGRLDVFSLNSGNGKAGQVMWATTNVSVNTPEFMARSHTLKFEEAKDQIILEGLDGGLVTLYKFVGPGKPPQEIRGTKIVYDRRTGAYWGEGLRVISGVQ